MPIVIDEVVISIEVAHADEACAAAADERTSLPAREALVDECVQKVLEILRRNHEQRD